MLTWSKFKEEFLEKFITLSHCLLREVEVYNLRQDKLLVSEYEKEFVALPRSADSYADTDEKHARRFRDDLK